MTMYALAIQRNFIAQHFLIGGDWGAENELHSHHYRIEVLLEGDRLDQHGYLVDIVSLEASMEALVTRYQDQILNDQPEFAGLNPSIEHYSRILCQAIEQDLDADNICVITLKVWENDIAWASFRLERPCE